MDQNPSNNGLEGVNLSEIADQAERAEANRVYAEQAAAAQRDFEVVERLRKEQEAAGINTSGGVLVPPTQGVTLGSTQPVVEENEIIGQQSTGIVIEQPETKPAPGGISLGNIPPDTMKNIQATLGEMEKEIDKEKATIEANGYNPEEVVKAADEAEKQRRANGGTYSEASSTEEEDEEVEPELSREEFDQKYNEAMILIDKTGIGELKLTAEEHEKLKHVNSITINEVKTIDLKTLRSKKAKKNSADRVLRQISDRNLTPVVLPASGYVGSMAGCSTYELMSLLGQTDNAMYDTRTKWTLLHSKLRETSIPVPDLDTFLKQTAVVDYNMLVFGVICATYPDDDKLKMNCPKCGTPFEYHYSVKSLLRAEKMDGKLSELVMKTVDNSHMEIQARQVHGDAPVNQTLAFELPSSGFVIELHVQSAYDLINRTVKGLSENKDPKYNQAAILSSAVRTILVPDPANEGEYLEYDDAMEITKFIYGLTDTDILIMSNQAEALLGNISFDFGLMNVECPTCHHTEQTIPVDLEQILFLKYQRATNTKVN